jgi:alpha-beta hydrolase superfamily lysophospholipase
MIRRFVLVGLLTLVLAGCVSFPDAPPATTRPAIAGDAVVSFDGARLGLTKWKAANPVAIIVAVHGMNDYAAAFTFAGPYWAEHGVSVFAYDQRGFGRSPDFGRWAGSAAMKQDLRSVVMAARANAPDLPVYVVGHSMGAAVILAAMKDEPLDVDGVVLAAPGVWGGASMSIFYRATLNLAAGFAPGKTLTGERAGRQASDNIEFLRAMYNDPLIIKDTRLDAILGAERIMGEAYDASNDVSGDFLVLFGGKDEIVPIKAMRKAAQRLCGDVEVISYADSWHLVFADLSRAQPLDDVLSWIAADGSQKKVWRPQDRKGELSDAAVSNCAGKSGQ